MTNTVMCHKCKKEMSIKASMYVCNWDYFPTKADEPDPIEPFKTTYYHPKCSPEVKEYI